MKLGVELLASRQAALRLGTFFETWLATPDGTVRRSLGRDEYHLSLTIAPGKRLAATGRNHTCQLDLEAAELGENQARPSILVPVDATAPTPLVWGLRTNLFLSSKALIEGSTGRLSRENGPPFSFGLDHPLVVVAEVAPGRYVIDISALLLS